MLILSMMLVASAGQGVELDPSGFGQYLIYPYFDL